MTVSPDDLLRRAKDEGLLPPDAVLPAEPARPWPVTLLTGLGAWLAAVPLLAVAGMLLGDWLSDGMGPYLVGALVLAAAVTVLRVRRLPLFIEQLAVPALIVGCGSLGIGLFGDLPAQGAAGVLALLALALACALPQTWLRSLLAAAAAWLTMFTVAPFDFGVLHSGIAPWLGAHLLLAIWLAALGLQRRILEARARAVQAAALESMMAGWLCALLATLAVLSGTSFLVGAVVGGELAGAFAGAWTAAVRALSFASALLALAAVLVAARAWPSLRRPLFLAAMFLTVVLAWMLPVLGAACLALALSVTSGRRLQAGAAALAMAWSIGSFYYHLQWTLQAKALVLVVLALLLGGLAWRMRAASAAAAPVVASRRSPALLACAVIAALVVVNVGIWRNEALIDHGRPVFVELAPVDPRSLMQGDYMRLEFRMPPEVRDALKDHPPHGRPHVVARLDARGVARIIRLEREGSTLARDEVRIELTPKNGRWVVVTDAWFFAEGQSARWESARYGELRVDANGRALLVGMTDEKLRPIRPQ